MRVHNFVLAARVVPAVLFLHGCAASTASRPVGPVYVPRFDYSPPSAVAPGSAAVVFAVVMPQHARGAASGYVMGQNALTSATPFTRFSSSLGSDFQELLTARGYGVRGPYDTYEGMTYPDRQTSDLVLTPNLEVLVETKNLRQEMSVNILGPDSYWWTGVVAISGRVALSVNESLSNERMWVRSIEVPAADSPFTSAKYREGAVPPTVPVSDAGLTEALGKALDGIYPRILETAWNYLDPQEMVVVKQQSIEPRSKWVSVRRP